jgi:hypothetical protein
VLRRIVGAHRENVTKRLHCDELHNLYCSPNIRLIMLRMKWAGPVTRMGWTRNAYKVFVGHPEHLGFYGR